MEMGAVNNTSKIGNTPLTTWAGKKFCLEQNKITEIIISSQQMTLIGVRI